MNKYIAYYLRLSSDDGNIGESNSIVSQREIIKEYIYSSDEFVEAQTLEFVDDGYSGTNFNRPGIKQLLEAVKKGEVNGIIVKDFSRFGRNYLEVSKYIEQLFPYIGVRFIAVNDNYDSSNHKGTTAEIDVPVRNMINAMYSMDISKKVKSAKLTKNKQGIFSNAYTIYGYRKDKVDKGKMFIDEPAAAVVRKIFQLALDGNTTFQIAEKLNHERILTPAEYKNNNGNQKNWLTINKGKSIWTRHPVYNILKDERYTGTFVGGMRENNLRSNKQIKKPKEEWIRVPNSHPAIITQEQFDTISRMLPKHPYKRSTANKNSHNLLYKKVWCGRCGHRLCYRCPYTGKSYYFCETSKYTDEYGCMGGIFHEKELKEAILFTLLTQINLFTDYEKVYRMIKNKISKPDNSIESSVLQLDNEINNLQTNRRKLYEQYKNEQINQTLYLKEREILEKDLTGKTKLRESLAAQKQNHKDVTESMQQLSEKFLKYQNETELTKEIVDGFIEKISVHSNERIEVKFSFKDELTNILNLIKTK